MDEPNIDNNPQRRNTLTLGLLPTPGVFWISHMPSEKPLLRTPQPYFILFPTKGTMFLRRT